MAVLAIIITSSIVFPVLTLLLVQHHPAGADLSPSTPACKTTTSEGASKQRDQSGVAQTLDLLLIFPAEPPRNKQKKCSLTERTARGMNGSSVLGLCTVDVLE